MTERVRAKIEEIARMRIAKKTNSEIANAMNMSYGGLSRILATSEYQDYERALREENNLGLDLRLEARRKLMIEVENAVPEALQVMLDTVKQKRDLRMQFAAAKEILDRDPQATLARRSSKAVDNANANPGAGAPLPSPVLEKLVNESTKVNDILHRQAAQAPPTPISSPSANPVPKEFVN